jgi:hypothetical protein
MANWIFLGAISINLDQVPSIRHGTLIWDPKECEVRNVTKITEKSRYFSICDCIIREDKNKKTFDVIYKYLCSKGWKESFDNEHRVNYYACQSGPYRHPTVVFKS